VDDGGLAHRQRTESGQAVHELVDHIENTDWANYGRGNNPKCENCMAHCGYEPTAVLATMGSLRESIRAAAGG